jgi:ferredoxin/flavodoxin---NADP+ reductase
MTFVITPGCCNDASCVAVCPVQCIRPRPGDPDFLSAEQLYIDPATCIDCQACMDECPIDAVHADYDLPDGFGDLLAINAEYFRDNPIVESGPPPHVRVRLPESRPELRVAVVGTGPAACYAVEALASVKGVRVSVLERLPTPFGLVRAGVAPDHDKTKRITTRFQRALGRASVECHFNVTVGKDVSVADLLEHHHAVIWAAGASSDRRLAIPGEEMPGSHSAREFVAWYNGHPDHATDTHDLSGERVVLIGNGNVALDVARSLVNPEDVRSASDMAEAAQEALRNSAVREVCIVARRGPEYAAYTTGELEALARIPDVDLVADPSELGDLAGVSDRCRRILEAATGRQPVAGRRRVVIRFGLTPQSIDGAGRVEGVTFRRADGMDEHISTHLVLRAVGYTGAATPGLPFDETTARIPNVVGRVVHPATGRALPGLYCSGWIKRGATGVIGTNKVDAEETVAGLLHDFSNGELADPTGEPDDFAGLVRSRQPDVVDYAAWCRIDAAERARGRDANRSRVKFVSVEELLAASRT